jgi:hypothetical protein
VLLLVQMAMSEEERLTHVVTLTLLELFGADHVVKD